MKTVGYCRSVSVSPDFGHYNQIGKKCVGMRSSSSSEVLRTRMHNISDASCSHRHTEPRPGEVSDPLLRLWTYLHSLAGFRIPVCNGTLQFREVETSVDANTRTQSPAVSLLLVLEDAIRNGSIGGMEVPRPA